MAQYPCSIDNARYRGRQQTFYVAIVKGTESQRYRLRLCAPHFAAAQDYLTEFKVNPVDGTVSWFGSGAKCVSCLQPMDERGWQFFGTSYPADQEREDYWGGLHDFHDPPECLIAADGPLALPSRTLLTQVVQQAAVLVQPELPMASLGPQRKR